MMYVQLSTTEWGGLCFALAVIIVVAKVLEYMLYLIEKRVQYRANEDSYINAERMKYTQRKKRKKHFFS